MARARNIKPAFFTNDELVELPMATRLLFIGLWTLADREGRLEDRPKKIKMEVFPADDVNVDEALSTLVSSAFIQRYRVEDTGYIQVINFSKHQRPHSNETPSTIPPPAKGGTKTPPEKARQINENEPASNHGEQDVQPRSQALRPDTLNTDTPFTDTGLIDSDSGLDADASQESESRSPLSKVQQSRFDRWYKVYPRKAKRQAAVRAWAKITPAPTDALTEQMITKVEEWTGSDEWSDPQYIPHPATWLNDGRWTDGPPTRRKPGGLTIHTGGRSQANASGQQNLTDQELDDIIYGRTG